VAHPLSWGGVFAGVAVGFALQIVLLLIGAAAALPVFDPGHPAMPTSLAFVVGVWDVASMALAALVGGYIAARASGLRRTGDGVMHGAALWGTMTVLSAGLVLTESGGGFGGLYLALVQFDPADARSAAAAGWLAAAIMLALLAAVAGGAAGIRAGRRLERLSLRTVGAAAASDGAVREAD
jgi:hypothetical protein